MNPPYRPVKENIPIKIEKIDEINKLI